MLCCEQIEGGCCSTSRLNLHSQPAPGVSARTEAGFRSQRATGFGFDAGQRTREVALFVWSCLLADQITPALFQTSLVGGLVDAATSEVGGRVDQYLRDRRQYQAPSI